MNRIGYSLLPFLIGLLLVSCKKHSIVAYSDAADRHLYQNQQLGKEINYAGVQKHLISCAMHNDTSPSDVKAVCLLRARALQQQQKVNVSGWPAEDKEWAKVANAALSKSCGDGAKSETLECLISVSLFQSEMDSAAESFSNAYEKAVTAVKECALSGDYSCIDALIQASTYASKNDVTKRFSSSSIGDCLNDWRKPDFYCMFALSSYRASGNEVALRSAMPASQYGLSVVRQCANSGNPFCMSRWAIALYSGDCQSEAERGDAVKWFSLAARYGDNIAQSYLIRLGHPVPAPDLKDTFHSTGKARFVGAPEILYKEQCSVVKEIYSDTLRV